MEELLGRVAVVTGAASGIGRSLARRFAREQMGLVLADVDEDGLSALVDELAGEGIEVLGVPTDVSDAGAMDRLAEAALGRFERVNVVCNNAGVSGSMAPVAELTTADWAWVLGPNLWGVIHGHRVFQRHLMSHGDGHIVNTASVAGLTSFQGAAPYHASKHAVVALSEVVYSELAAVSSTVGISVLCPGWVDTRIGESNPHLEPEMVPLLRGFFASKQGPDEVADVVVDAIRERRFYVYSADTWSEKVAERHGDIQAARNPRPKGSMFEETA